MEAILSKFEEKIARSEQLRLAHLASVVQRAGDETRKVREWVDRVAYLRNVMLRQCVEGDTSGESACLACKRAKLCAKQRRMKLPWLAHV